MLLLLDGASRGGNSFDSIIIENSLSLDMYSVDTHTYVFSIMCSSIVCVYVT